MTICVGEAQSQHATAAGSPTFEALWLEHRPRLACAARGLTNNRDDAEDLVQDTLLRAFCYYDRFEAGSNFAGWAMRILYNTYCSGWREAKRRPDAVPWEPIHDRPGAWPPDSIGPREPAQPERMMLAGVADEELETALRGLPREFRETFELASLRGLTYAEISDVMQLPIGTVRSRLFRARAQLRTRLAAYGKRHGLLEPTAANPG